MDIQVADFNGAAGVFDQGGGAEDWHSMVEVLQAVPLCLQASDQRGRLGRPIFDPKGTNARLTQGARTRGWTAPVPVPAELQMFGNDWDAGRGVTLAEWQFSNYPFLWNNIIRSEAVFKGRVALGGLSEIQGIIVVTKSGELPASNSTLYFEQAEAQIRAVLQYETFEIPIRLVGLALEPGAEEVPAVWTTYSGRYAREPVTSEKRRLHVTRGRGRAVRLVADSSR